MDKVVPPTNRVKMISYPKITEFSEFSKNVFIIGYSILKNMNTIMLTLWGYFSNTRSIMDIKLPILDIAANLIFLGQIFLFSSKYTFNWNNRQLTFHCLDVTTQPKEPVPFYRYMQPIATIGINIDHFLCLNIICRHFISIKRGTLEFFFKIH